MPNDKPTLNIQEIKDVAMANQLLASGDYLQPHYSDKRDCYIFIPKKVR